jgi:anti-anti-sigma regulatory factor
MKKTRAVDGKLYLVGTKDNVMEVFKLTLLDRVFQFYEDVGSAKDAL